MNEPTGIDSVTGTNGEPVGASLRDRRGDGARATRIAIVVLLLVIAVWFAPVLVPGPGPWLGRTLLSLDERFCPPFVQDADASVATRPQNLITSDLQGWILSHTQTAVERMRRGELPLWDSHELLGRPLHADASFPTFYPPDWIYLAVDPLRGYALSSALHVALATIGMLVLLRRFGLPTLAAVAGALAFGMGGWMFVHLHVPHFVRSAAWFPWLVLASHRLAAAPGPRRAAVLAVVVGLATLAAYPQILGVMLFVTGAAAATFVARSTARVPAASWHLGAFAVGALLGAVELLPIAELRAASLRDENLPEEVARAKSLRPAHLLSLVAPDFQGHPVALQQAGIARVEEWPPARELFGSEIQDNYVENTLYAGVVTLLLAIVALVASRRRVPLLGFALLVALGLLIAWSTPLQPLFRKFLIPGLGAGSPKRALLISALGLAGLGALGLEPLLRGERRARVALLTSGLLISGLGAAALVAMRMVLPAWLRAAEEGARAAAVRSLLDRAFGVPAAIALVVAALSPWFRGRRAMIAGGALVVLLATDLALFGWRFNPFQPPEAQGRPTGVVEFLQRPENRGRTLRYPTRLLLPASLVSKWGIASVDGIQALLIREVGELLDALEPGVVDRASLNQIGSFDGIPDADADASHPPDPTFLSRPLSALLARWIVANRALPPELGFSVRYMGPREGLGVFENPRALPECFFVDRVCVEPDRARRLARIVAADFAPARVALVESEADVAELPATSRVDSAAAPTDAAPDVSIRSDRILPERLRADVKTPVPGVLVANEAFFRGWRVRVDGSERAPIRVDHALMGVVLPAGEHRLEFDYSPRSFTIGAVLSLAAASVLLALLLLRLPAHSVEDFSSSSSSRPDPAPGTRALAPDPPA